MSEVTVEDLKNLSKAIKEARERHDVSSQETKALKSEVDDLEEQMVATLKALKLKNFKCEYGVASVSHRFSVKLPQGEAKDRFFDYLKDMDLFDQLISINSKTLTAWYKIEAEKASQEKRLLNIPGLDMATSQEILSFKKA